MKRLMMLVAMMAFVLLLPINAEAAGETVIEEDVVIDNYCELYENTTIDGDLYIDSYGMLWVLGCELKVTGNVYVRSNEMSVIGEGKMTVGGDFIMESGDFLIMDGTLNVENDVVIEGNYLFLAGGTMSVKGDLRVQDKYNNTYSTGRGSIYPTGKEDGYGPSTIVVGGSFYIDTYEDIIMNESVISVAGNIEQLSDEKFAPAHVILNGTKPQSVTLQAGSVIDTLEITQAIGQYTFNPNPCWNKLIEKGAQPGNGGDTNESNKTENITGLVNTADGFLYYENGKWADKAYKFVDFEGGKFLVANGKVATHINGLAQDPEKPSDWYYLSCGQAQTQYTGLAMYDNEWFYVEKGKLDTTKSGYVKYNGGLFYVGAGRYLSNVSGLAQDPNTGAWYFLANGQAQTQYTGLTQYDGKWFYVQKGILAEDFTGKVKYDGQYFNVVNGMVK